MTRAGFTLIELLVVLALVGISAGLAGLAIGATGTPPDDRRTQLADARALAIREARYVVVIVDRDTVRFYPDGSAVGPEDLVDPWTGASRATP